MNDTATKMRAFTDVVATKEELIANLEAHAEADRFVKGTYGEGSLEEGTFKGCAVGCSIVDFGGVKSAHLEYERLFGIPAQLAALEDGIFEALPEEKAMQWPLRFANAIQTGADLSNVWPQFAAWMMLDDEWGLIKLDLPEDVAEIVTRVGLAYGRMATGEVISDSEAEAIAEDAWAARAAWAARDAWAARAARAAWAAWAARAARDAWDAWAARDAYVAASSDKLIELLSAATPSPVAA